MKPLIWNATMGISAALWVFLAALALVPVHVEAHLTVHKLTLGFVDDYDLSRLRLSGVWTSPYQADLALRWAKREPYKLAGTTPPWFGEEAGTYRTPDVEPMWFLKMWLPTLAALSLVSVPPLLVLINLFKRARRIRRGRCLNCGYDLRASRERCPECGTPFTTKENEPQRTQSAQS